MTDNNKPRHQYPRITDSIISHSKTHLDLTGDVNNIEFVVVPGDKAKLDLRIAGRVYSIQVRGVSND